MLIDKDGVAIKLYEYGDMLVKGSYETMKYTVIMLDPDGKKINMTGTMYKGGDRVYIDKEFEQIVLDTLGRNSSVAFYLKSNGTFSSSEYLFKIENTSYFDNAFSMLK